MLVKDWFLSSNTKRLSRLLTIALNGLSITRLAILAGIATPRAKIIVVAQVCHEASLA